ncbi:MAG: tetratricopeptide repeat protein, partial [bacterium]|nr:tetratricopeptide repeat protein [bacterium]
MPRLNKTRRMAIVAPVLAAAVLLASCDSAEERADNHFHRGTLLMAEGDPVKASLEFRNALKLREDFVEALFALGKAQESLEHLDAAVQAYLSVAAQVPEHVEARVRLAVILASAGSPDDARRYADEAYALSPENVNVLVAKAAAALKLDNRGDAVRLSQAALEKEPHNTDALIILASERLKGADPTGALTLIDRGLQKNPRSLGLQYLKVNALDAL